MASSSSSQTAIGIPDEAHFETVVDPKEKLISVPWSVVDAWVRANVPHCGVKISSGGRSMNARFCVSDEAFIFYADKVAEFFGFTEPTRVLMTYIISQNTFFLDALGDNGTQESYDENEIISLTSSGDESEYDCDQSDDQLNESQNQQMIVYNEGINAQYEPHHTVTWSKTVTAPVVAYRSKQSLHFMKYISRRFLQNQHIMLLKCEETGFKYMCKVESSKTPDENGIFLKRIGEGWYKFKDEHNLRVGDNLRFEMSFYPYVLKLLVSLPSTSFSDTTSNCTPPQVDKFYELYLTKQEQKLNLEKEPEDCKGEFEKKKKKTKQRLALPSRELQASCFKVGEALHHFEDTEIRAERIS
ncbi:hypothetical protein P8452_56882 [Trifolium repens]|nr:hypothetical protein P8452_56882 [Trifolium repens]